MSAKVKSGGHRRASALQAVSFQRTLTGIVMLAVAGAGLPASAQPSTSLPALQLRAAAAAAPAPAATQGPQSYNIAQALSDQAQLGTISFEGLAFLTGGFGAATFIPPGKVGDYFGFQYMRDIDLAGMGHNPLFLNRIAANVLNILSSDQKALFLTEAAAEAPQYYTVALRRFPLIQAFYNQLNAQYPTASTGLNQASVIAYGGTDFVNENTLAYERAAAYGKVAASLTTSQKAALAKLQFGNFNSWAALDIANYMPPAGTAPLAAAAYMTLASEFFSWYAGSVTADTYFCPERHGTYFGGFYLKDAPVVGQTNYNISTALTGDLGAAFMNVLTTQQQATITAILSAQRTSLSQIVTIRQAISTELRKFLSGGTADKATILALGQQYGQLDGKLAYMYSTAFTTVAKTLSADQTTALAKLRASAGVYTAAAAYIYADALTAVPSFDSSILFYPPQ